MILNGIELHELAEEFKGGGPVRLPDNADETDTLTRLATFPGLEGVHVAEHTEGDGTILMP